MLYRQVSNHPSTSRTERIHEIQSISMDTRSPEGDDPAGFITVKGVRCVYFNTPIDMHLSAISFLLCGLYPMDKQVITMQCFRRCIGDQYPLCLPWTRTIAKSGSASPRSTRLSISHMRNRTQFYRNGDADVGPSSRGNRRLSAIGMSRNGILRLLSANRGWDVFGVHHAAHALSTNLPRSWP
jgi:hypothetical protein